MRFGHRRKRLFRHGFQAGARPLFMADEGSRVRIMDLNCGYGLQARLASLGIINGREVQIIRNRGRGPLIVEAMNGRIMLGRRMAHMILVN